MATNTAKKASQNDWHPADIKAALHKRGITLKGIADAHGLTSSSTLSQALVRSYPANEKRIADALALHPKDIWPSRYNADGSHKPQGFRAVQSTAALQARNGTSFKPRKKTKENGTAWSRIFSRSKLPILQWSSSPSAGAKPVS